MQRNVMLYMLCYVMLCYAIVWYGIVWYGGMVWYENIVDVCMYIHTHIYIYRHT